MSIEVIPSGGALGAEIRGINLAKLLMMPRSPRSSGPTTIATGKSHRHNFGRQPRRSVFGET
jgi:hypothetical protein